MFRILVVDGGAIDRKMIRKVLCDHLSGAAEVLQAAGREDARPILERQRVDLLIVDVPGATAAVRNLVRMAQSGNRDVRVILTSVRSGGDTARLAAQLEVGRYLLKPFRGEELLEMVRPMMAAAQEREVRTGNAEQSGCLRAIGNCMQEYQYKNSLETAKEYIDFLFRSDENMSIVRSKAVEFIAGLAELGRSRSEDAGRRLDGVLERFRLRFDLQSSAFEVAGVAEEMLDIIFSELERSQLYSGDDLKKVLNFIDRNIKKGVTLDAAAAYAGMSSSYFSKFFKKFMGVNFITYVTDRKIEFAKDMLENTDRPVINIAYDLSYSETNYFSKTFKKKVGVTPTEYREQYLNGQAALRAGSG